MVKQFLFNELKFFYPQIKSISFIHSFDIFNICNSIFNIKDLSVISVLNQKFIAQVKSTPDWCKFLS